MSVENMDIETMTEVWNSWAEINRQKDAEIRKLKEANSGSVINLRLKILKEENKKLGEENLELQGKKDYWEGEHSDLWLGVFGVLNDAGYGPTSTGQLISFIKDIIAENEKLKELMKDAISCKKLVNDYMNKTKGFAEWASWDDCDGDVVDYAIYLEKEIEKLKNKELKKPKKTITCSSCGQTGHNKTSKKCPNIIDA